MTSGQEPDSLSIRTEVAAGPYLVGQGFEMGVGVVATGRRPRIDPPRISGGRAWTIGTDLKPISVSGVGGVVAQQNLYLTRFRVVARRPGTLEIPSMGIQVQNRSGRTQPKRLLIQSVPLEGRPSGFLGGVGRFSVQAEAIPKTLRVGQELDFRITVMGPAAWGMTNHPDLTSYQELGLTSRVESRPNETVDEPPSRTFIYKLRPIKAGEIVLPPVAIASFDPSLSRYITQVTASVPVRVVAVTTFDPSTIEDSASNGDPGPSNWLAGIIWVSSAVSLMGASVALTVARRRMRHSVRYGPIAARRFAAHLARTFASNARSTSPIYNQEPYEAVARRVSDALIRYLELGIGRPTGALTPDEARLGVITLTDSEDLGERAGRLTDRCDLVQFGHQAAAPAARELGEDARGLFGALGRVERWRGRTR